MILQDTQRIEVPISQSRLRLVTLLSCTCVPVRTPDWDEERDFTKHYEKGVLASASNVAAHAAAAGGGRRSRSGCASPAAS